jgi:hypothetical protein
MVRRRAAIPGPSCHEFLPWSWEKRRCTITEARAVGIVLQAGACWGLPRKLFASRDADAAVLRNWLP